MTTKQRLRNRGAIVTLRTQERLYDKNQPLLPGTWRDSGTPVKRGQTEAMEDWVTTPFVPGKSLINTPMKKTLVTRTFRPCYGSEELFGSTSSPNRVEGERARDRDVSFDSLLINSDQDLNSLISQAATQALANVNKPEVMGLVALAELKDTINVLRNPIGGALNWLKQNASTNKSRKKSKARRRFKELAINASDQHLSVIFGLLPFIEDVQGTLKAMKGDYDNRVQYTARGFASTSFSNSKASFDIVYQSGAQKTTLDYSDQVTRQFTVRAYCLYEVQRDLQSSMGLTLQEFPLSAYQVIPFSFVEGWFSNVGDYIASLVPRVGTTVLASGYTVQDNALCSSSYSENITNTGSSGWRGQFSGGETTRAVMVKSRVPGDLNRLTAITLKRSMGRDTLDTYRLTAAISLITQKLKQLL